MLEQAVNPHFHPEPRAGFTMVVFDDHRFCAGQSELVQVMAAPHRHTQFEINHLISGAVTYWFDGRLVEIAAGQTVVFWGMVPHQTVARAEGARFTCLYIPAALFMQLPISEALRGALFRGSMVAGSLPYDTDAVLFQRWREDLLKDDPHLEDVVRDEVSARIRRLDHDGWHDLYGPAPASTAVRSRQNRSDKVDAMVRHIGSGAGEPLTVEAVARAAGLHPNYAMALFKRTLGVTIRDYIVRSRLDAAQSLLVSSDAKIADIAFEAGFGSLSRFYEAFHARFGITPARMRRLRALGG
jgi:AraC family transcriptional regulator, melibiose operon regulatory protein